MADEYFDMNEGVRMMGALTAIGKLGRDVRYRQEEETAINVYLPILDKGGKITEGQDVETADGKTVKYSFPAHYRAQMLSMDKQMKEGSLKNQMMQERLNQYKMDKVEGNKVINRARALEEAGYPDLAIDEMRKGFNELENTPYDIEVSPVDPTKQGAMESPSQWRIVAQDGSFEKEIPPMSLEQMYGFANELVGESNQSLQSWLGKREVNKQKNIENSKPENIHRYINKKDGSEIYVVHNYDQKGNYQPKAIDAKGDDITAKLTDDVKKLGSAIKREYRLDSDQAKLVKANNAQRAKKRELERTEETHSYSQMQKFASLLGVKIGGKTDGGLSGLIAGGGAAATPEQGNAIKQMENFLINGNDNEKAIAREFWKHADKLGIVPAQGVGGGQPGSDTPLNVDPSGTIAAQMSKGRKGAIGAPAALQYTSGQVRADLPGFAGSLPGAPPAAVPDVRREEGTPFEQSLGKYYGEIPPEQPDIEKISVERPGAIGPYAIGPDVPGQIPPQDPTGQIQTTYPREAPIYPNVPYDPNNLQNMYGTGNRAALSP